MSICVVVPDSTLDVVIACLQYRLDVLEERMAFSRNHFGVALQVGTTIYQDRVRIQNEIERTKTAFIQLQMAKSTA